MYIGYYEINQSSNKHVVEAKSVYIFLVALAFVIIKCCIGYGNL